MELSFLFDGWARIFRLYAYEIVLLLALIAYMVRVKAVRLKVLNDARLVLVC